MELRQLRYFVAVADTLNFSRASESLYVSQSALSKQIADLEQELGVRLFQRDKRTVELSCAGRLLLGEAKAILLRSEKLVPLLQEKDQQSQQERTIYIGVETRAEQSPQIHHVLAEIVYQKRQNMPGLQAVFQSRDYVELKKALLDDELDLGLFFSTEREAGSGLETCVLYEDEMVLVYRGEETCGQSEDEIRAFFIRRGVVLLEKEFRGMSQIMHILDELGSAPQVRFCENGTAMKLTIESGESSAVIPLSIVSSFSNKKLHVVHFRKEAAKIYLIAVWKKGGNHTLAEQLALNTAAYIRKRQDIFPMIRIPRHPESISQQ